MLELSDHECLVLVLRNPRNSRDYEQAYAILFQRYDGRLQCHVRFSFPGLRSEDLQEVCQDTWLKVLRCLNEKIRPEAFRAWLYQIGKNLAIDLIRRKAARAEKAMAEQDLASPDVNHAEAMASTEQLKQCVDRLPEKFRDFTRRLLNLENFDEIAEATHLPKSRIYQIKHEIGKLLTRCMEQGL